MKNHYLLGIYKGAAQKIHLDEQLTDFNFHYTKQEMKVNSNLSCTFLLAEIDTDLNVEMTEQFHLFTKQIQALPFSEHCYFIYDYKNRKLVTKPLQLCFPLMKIETSVLKLEKIIQTMKDVKYPVFAGFKVHCVPSSHSVVVEICISSQLLEKLHAGTAISYNQIKDDSEYLYLQTLESLLSKKDRADNVLSSELLCKENSFN